MENIPQQSRIATGFGRFLYSPYGLFEVLFVFIVLAHDRRRVVHFNVTAHPTAEWTAQQTREAFPFDCPY